MLECSLSRRRRRWPCEQSRFSTDARANGTRRSCASDCEVCPKRRRPQHRHSRTHLAPPLETDRSVALHLQPGSRRGRAGRQAGPARERVDRLRASAIDADDHRLAGRVPHHASERARAVPGHRAEPGRPVGRADRVRDGRAAAAARRRLSSRLVRTARRGPARRARQARWVAGGAERSRLGWRR